MAESNKPVRLSKVAREFNLGMTTVVEFLASKGIEVEANPNSKLDPATYALVKSNFQGDKETKEKAQASAATIQERESITLASAKKRAAAKQVEDEPEIDLSQFRKSEAAPVVKRTKPVEAEASAQTDKEKAKPAAKKAAAAEKEGPKVVGKVDLDALKPRKPLLRNRQNLVRLNQKRLNRKLTRQPKARQKHPRLMPLSRWYALRRKSCQALRS